VPITQNAPEVQKSIRVRSVSCVWLPLSAGAGLAEAIAAVDWAIAGRLERHFGVLAAFSADYRVHFPRGTAVAAAPFGFPCLTTRRTPLGIVREALAGMELLLFGGKVERGTTVGAFK
jgi:hypothetical protein